VDSFHPTVPQIADFLLYLFKDRNLAVSTVQGYKSAIASTIKQATGTELGSSPVLRDLLSSFFLERPRSQFQLPQWDLALVLRCLLRPPFEPMANAELRYVTLKTVFLLTLAAGKRRGEMHALLDTVQHTEGWTSVTIRPSPTFLAKTHVLSNPAGAFTEVTVPALTQIVDRSEPDARLCPVRALRFYLDRTKALRQGRSKPCKLFISYKVGHKGDVRAPTISAWIRKTVSEAYESVSEEDAQLFTSGRAHELRALSASWTAFRTLNLDQVFKAASWRAHTTFTSFYLRDMTLMSDDLLTLGPLVTSQMVVPGRGGSSSK